MIFIVGALPEWKLFCKTCSGKQRIVGSAVQEGKVQNVSMHLRGRPPADPARWSHPVKDQEIVLQRHPPKKDSILILFNIISMPLYVRWRQFMSEVWVEIPAKRPDGAGRDGSQRAVQVVVELLPNGYGVIITWSEAIHKCVIFSGPGVPVAYGLNPRLERYDLRREPSWDPRIVESHKQSLGSTLTPGTSNMYCEARYFTSKGTRELPPMPLKGNHGVATR